MKNKHQIMAKIEEALQLLGEEMESRNLSENWIRHMHEKANILRDCLVKLERLETRDSK